MEARRHVDFTDGELAAPVEKTATDPMEKTAASGRRG
jgi:hypothetical protein